MFIGVNTYYPHYHELYNSSKSLLNLIKIGWEEEMKEDRDGIKKGDFNINKRLIYPFVLTYYSFFECFLSELEDSIRNGDIKLPYTNDKKPRMEERPFIIYDLINPNEFDKGTSIYLDYYYVIKLRNLISHSSGELIKWSDFHLMSVGEKCSFNGYFLDKEDFKRMKLKGKIIRDERADKLIKYLVGKKLVPDGYHERVIGWLYFISFPGVAFWMFNSISNIIKHLLDCLDESENDSIMKFSESARLEIFS